MKKQIVFTDVEFEALRHEIIQSIVFNDYGIRFCEYVKPDEIYRELSQRTATQKLVMCVDQVWPK